MTDETTTLTLAELRDIVEALKLQSNQRYWSAMRAEDETMCTYHAGRESGFGEILYTIDEREAGRPGPALYVY